MVCKKSIVYHHNLIKKWEKRIECLSVLDDENYLDVMYLNVFLVTISEGNKQYHSVMRYIFFHTETYF